MPSTPSATRCRGVDSIRPTDSQGRLQHSWSSRAEGDSRPRPHHVRGAPWCPWWDFGAPNCRKGAGSWCWSLVAGQARRPNRRPKPDRGRRSPAWALGIVGQPGSGRLSGTDRISGMIGVCRRQPRLARMQPQRCAPTVAATPGRRSRCAQHSIAAVCASGRICESICRMGAFAPTSCFRDGGWPCSLMGVIGTAAPSTARFRRATPISGGPRSSRPGVAISCRLSGSMPQVGPSFVSGSTSLSKARLSR